MQGPNWSTLSSRPRRRRGIRTRSIAWASHSSWTGQVDAAEASLRRVLAVQPQSAAANENLGVIFKQRVQPSLALPYFRRAHELDPDLSMAACNFAGTLATLGRNSEALAVLRMSLERHPSDTVGARLEAAIRADAGK